MLHQKTNLENVQSFKSKYEYIFSGIRKRATQIMKNIKEEKEMYTKINIYEAVRLFYGLQALVLKITTNPNFNSFYPSHNKLLKDVKIFQLNYEKKLANIIADYTTLVVAGEMRHAQRKCEEYFSEFYGAECGRDEVYAYSLDYSAIDLLRAGEYIFTKHWESGYGGEKWALIAKGGLMYYSSTHTVFIDHMVDISHNNSIYFDKGAGIIAPFDQDRYLSFLEKKKYGSLDEVLSYGVGSYFREFARRTNVLLGTNIWLPTWEFSQTDVQVMSYTPLHFRNNPFSFSTSSRYRSYRRDRRYRREED